MDDTPLWLLFSVLAGLLLLSAFFSGSETAMMSLNRYRLKHLRKRHLGARKAYKLLKRPDRLIGIILIGNNMVNILASAIATVIALRLYGDAGIAIATLLLTLAILIFSEVTPKTMAALHPEGIAFTASHILRPLLFVFYPLVWLVNHLSNGLLRLLGVNTTKSLDVSLSKEEIRTVVDISSENIPDHQDMLINILDLETVSVNDIMVPRNEIIGLDLELEVDQLLTTIINSGYTRLPVYVGNMNNVLGIIHVKTIARLLRSGSDSLTKEAIKRFTREPYFVPENTPLNKQLVNFQQAKRRIGLVVDEYGEIEGLVTMEDILEEIVGDFTTNRAEDEQEDIVALDKRMFDIDGSATIRDINKANSWDLPTDGPKTINGLILEHLESIPDGNVSFAIGRYQFETLELSEKMVVKVRVKQRITLHSGNGELDDDDED
ncbi:HlyC/CorC family transporter [Porticoccus sp.]|uniref:HlyC/CorC family transporter n=1 Tax=Porticoccus sp. TaxID=2024853 RepID=UPI000C5D0CDD|nr:HlyC/CorC family transporter [Porticoccus sp.]MAZ69324.1 magnesium/cobalt efflux protein [Porticoccus sp.]